MTTQLIYLQTGVLEAQFQRKTGELVELSEQNLVDCIQGSQCLGNWPDVAFEYVTKNGINAEADYPYKSKDGIGGTCLHNKSYSCGTLASY